MGQWGWRRLIFAFVLVWVVACDTRPQSTPTVTPTEYPPVTLIVRTPRTPSPNTPTNTQAPPTPHPQPTPAPQSSPLPPDSTRYATPTPLSLSVQPPNCYSGAGDVVQCLGLIQNSLDNSAERVVVWVELLNPDGSQLAARSVAVEQRHIAPGQTAPYRATFEGALASAGAYAVIQRADTAGDTSTALQVHNEQGVLLNGRYAVSADIDNTGVDPAYGVRAIVTLQDSARHVVGYRVVDLTDMLAAGAVVALKVEMRPLAEDSAYTHTLVVEAHGRQ